MSTPTPTPTPLPPVDDPKGWKDKVGSWMDNSKEHMKGNSFAMLIAVLLMMFIIFAIFYCNVEILVRSDLSVIHKTLWHMLVTIMPGLGSGVYYLAGRSGATIYV